MERGGLLAEPLRVLVVDADSEGIVESARQRIGDQNDDARIAAKGSAEIARLMARPAAANRLIIVLRASSDASGPLPPPSALSCWIDAMTAAFFTAALGRESRS